MEVAEYHLNLLTMNTFLNQCLRLIRQGLLHLEVSMDDGTRPCICYHKGNYYIGEKKATEYEVRWAIVEHYKRNAADYEEDQEYVELLYAMKCLNIP